MEDIQSVEFAAKEVFHQQIYSDELTFFSLRKKKIGLFVFQQRKVLLELLFKCLKMFKN